MGGPVIGGVVVRGVRETMAMAGVGDRGEVAAMFGMAAWECWRLAAAEPACACVRARARCVRPFCRA